MKKRNFSVTNVRTQLVESPLYVTNHVKTVHEGLRYPCDQCDYQGNSMQSLRKHIQSSHEGIKYECEHCNKKLATPACVRRHIRSVHLEKIK